MKRMLILILALLLILAVVVFLYRKQIIGHYVPEFEQKGEIQLEMKNDSVYLKSVISIRNKAFFRISLDSVFYKVSIHDQLYLKKEKVIAKELKAYQKDTFVFMLGIPFNTIMKDLRKAGRYSDSTQYLVQLILYFNTPIGKLEIPFRKSAKFKLPEFPIIEIVEVEFTKWGLNRIKAFVKIKINNSSHVRIKIHDLKYYMQIYRAGIVYGGYDQEILLDSNKTTLVNLPILINPSNFGKTILRILLNKDIYHYKLNLHAILETSGPIKDTFLLNVVKNGQLELRKPKHLRK